MMRGLRRYRAALPRLQAIEVPRRAGLDHHRALEADKAVGDLVVVMPRDFLPGGQGQYRDPHIGAFGDDLAGGDLVIAAIAVLHRSVPSSTIPEYQVSRGPRACRAVEIVAASARRHRVTKKREGEMRQGRLGLRGAVAAVALGMMAGAASAQIMIVGKDET